MIHIDNRFEVRNTVMPLTDVEVGTAFLGVVEDSEGEEHSGLFFRTYNGVLFLEDLSVVFDTFSEDDDSDYVPKVKNYSEVDVSITVEHVYD